MFKKAIIIVAALLLTACSGKSKQEMLMSHDWYYDSYISKPAMELNGKSIEDLQSINCFSRDCYVSFKEKSFDIYMDDKNCLSRGKEAHANALYKILDNNKMEVKNNASGLSIEWDIIELTEDVFHYKAEVSGKAYNEIRLVK